MCRAASRPEEPDNCGFTLLETVAALTIFGIAILIAAGFLDAQMQAAHRMQVRADLLRATEIVLESARGGALPLASGAVDLNGQYEPRSDHVVHASLEVVESVEHPGLYEVTATATARLRGRQEALSITTRVWRP
jgi:prepilin-type N-terminal cleavage/methylation domain-containing protein